MKIAAITIGCKVNQYDSHAILELFEQADFEVVDAHQKADVYVISTCTVTAVADKKSRQMINRAKRNNPNAVVVAAGCMSQSEGEKLKDTCSVDVVVGNNDRSKIVEIVLDKIKHVESSYKVDYDIRDIDDFEEMKISKAADKTRAFIKIQEGCNNFCTYCIIPYVRGKLRSRKKENIIEEAKRLVESGVLEIVLTGINVSSYGLDFDDNIKLINLMQDLDKIDGLKRLRLGSMEPMLIDEDFCEKAKRLKTFCPHFHLSLQSGSDGVLKRMNRKYTSDDFYNIVLMLRKHFENPSLTTDIIVGFPQESEAEFLETVEFVKKVEFSKIHVFPYSIRKNTVAANMDGQIDGSVKKKRVQVLSDVAEGFHESYASSFVGKSVDVLFEEPDSNIDGNFVGYTKRYIKVSAKAHANEIKSFVVSRCDGDILFE